MSRSPSTRQPGIARSRGNPIWGIPLRAGRCGESVFKAVGGHEWKGCSRRDWHLRSDVINHGVGILWGLGKVILRVGDNVSLLEGFLLEARCAERK